MVELPAAIQIPLAVSGKLKKVTLAGAQKATIKWTYANGMVTIQVPASSPHAFRHSVMFRFDL